MEIYKRLLMTYIDKYKRLDLDMLTEEMRLTETQIVDIVYSLIEEGFVYMKDHKYKISEKGKNLYFLCGMSGHFVVIRNEEIQIKILLGIICIFLRICYNKFKSN